MAIHFGINRIHYRKKTKLMKYTRMNPDSALQCPPLNYHSWGRPAPLATAIIFTLFKLLFNVLLRIAFVYTPICHSLLGDRCWLKHLPHHCYSYCISFHKRSSQIIFDVPIKLGQPSHADAVAPTHVLR